MYYLVNLYNTSEHFVALLVLGLLFNFTSLCGYICLIFVN